MDTTLSSLHAGQLLDGRYRVGSWIARGGMATVYLGTDTKLDRTVALKVAHAELADDPEFVRRFAGEARSVARLSSPNVVAVYDQNSDAGVLYLVMEYVPGRTLRELLRERGRLSPREALDVISGVLAGLAAAHRAGIVHRDVKPENVLLGDGNTIKVADFGLARATSRASHTRTGMLIGTAAYLAPEQVSRSVSDARTDVYAAGVMLYELLTGAQPHTGETPLAVAHKHVSDPVPAPSSAVPGLPPSLDALVALATSRDPDLRPADAGQFLRAIADVRRGIPIGGAGAAPVGPQPPPPLPAALLAATIPPGAALPAAPPAAVPPGSPAAAGPPAEFPWFDEADPMPGPQNGTNHTLVVPAASAAYDSAAHGGIPYDGVPYGGLPYGEGDGPDAYPGRRPGRSRRGGEPLLQRWLFSRRLVYLTLALAAVLIVGLITWWVTDGQYVTVPAVRAMAASTARAELENLGFAVKVAPAKHDRVIAKGDVIATDPTTGTSAKRGAVVTMIVSSGPIMISVPQVTGLNQAAAEAALRKAGLTPGAVTQTASDTIGAGIVVSTDPVAGTSWPQTKPVGITVSAGPPLPDFVGQQFQDAQGQAQSGGYQLQQVPDANSSQPQGTITSQSPAPGTPITSGEVVTVHVSNGPPEAPVPDVTGDNVHQATRILEQAGFKVQVSSGIFSSNTVSGESPSGQAPQGSTITLTLGFSFP
jgi:beta-lactam-binding protein with PASTA domain/predicted Ser/Thr protein kinase